MKAIKQFKSITNLQGSQTDFKTGRRRKLFKSITNLQGSQTDERN